MIELFARENKYAWNSTIFDTDLGKQCLLNMSNVTLLQCYNNTKHVHLLLKQGLKIGYLPPTQYNRKLRVYAI